MADIIADDDTNDDVTCYITNDEEIALEGEKPHVVCTSEPEEVKILFINTLIDPNLI